MKTPFYEEHRSLNAKMVDFHGWLMPLQYSAGIINEHLSVRARAGLFDVSHMGRFEVKGPNSLELLQNLTTNDISKITPSSLTNQQHNHCHLFLMIFVKTHLYNQPYNHY